MMLQCLRNAVKSKNLEILRGKKNEKFLTTHINDIKIVKIPLKCGIKENAAPIYLRKS